MRLLPLLLGGCASAHIDSIIVVMLENRAFDHMLGFMAQGGPQGDTRVDGITDPSKFCNVAEGKTVCVTKDAVDECPYDPNHSWEATTERIFDCKYGVTKDTPCTEPKNITGKASMGGFVQSGIYNNHTGVNEMTMWDPEKVPIITTLAKEFANFDYYFCSHPGPTYPNRQFVVSGTAYGEQNDEVPSEGFPQKTIFRLLEENSRTWKMYYEDSLAWALFNADLRRPEAKPFLVDMSEFYNDAKKGTLPHFGFIEPRIASKYDPNLPSYGLANHQHPTASVREGERFMKNVYEAVRNGPKWNSTLLLITYDEHGGFYDHVSPPQTSVPEPDTHDTPSGFKYERLGIRVPMIAISPWIERGVLVHEPPASQKPQPSSQWEHSSVVATVSKIYQLKGAPLTKRDAWAATFEHLLSLSEPRTDCPAQLPVVPPPPPPVVARLPSLPVDEHCRALANLLCQLAPHKDEELSQTLAHLLVKNEEQDQHNRETEQRMCEELSICPPPKGMQRTCGEGFLTNSATFTEWRRMMWAEWLKQ